MELAATDPVVTEGPVINGEKTILTLYTHTQLQDYPYMRQFNDLVNKAYSETPSMTALFPDIKKFPRLGGDEALFKDIGPSFFTFICTSANTEPNHENIEAGQPKQECPALTIPPRHFATASCRKLWPKAAKESDTPFFKDMANKMIQIGRGLGEHLDLWELKIIAVDPDLQRTGLASLLMRLVEAEALKQSAAKSLRRAEFQAPSVPNPETEMTLTAGPGRPRVIMLLDTLLEENAAYYGRRGYRAVDHLIAPAGTFNSTRSFRAEFMQKEISMD